MICACQTCQLPQARMHRPTTIRMRLKPVKSSPPLAPPREDRAILPPSPGVGARDLARRLTARLALEAHRLFIDEAHVLELMNGGMRVIERDALPKVAARLVERLAENPGAAFDIGAETVSKRPVSLLARGAPVLSDLAEPCVIDLHRADVDSAVRVLTDGAEPPTLDADQEHENAGGQVMDVGRRLQTPLDHRLIGFRRNGERKPDRQSRERQRREESSSPPIALPPDSRCDHPNAFLASARGVASSNTRARSSTIPPPGRATIAIASMTDNRTQESPSARIASIRQDMSAPRSRFSA